MFQVHLLNYLYFEGKETLTLINKFLNPNYDNWKLVVIFDLPNERLDGIKTIVSAFEFIIQEACILRLSEYVSVASLIDIHS